MKKYLFIFITTLLLSGCLPKNKSISDSANQMEKGKTETYKYQSLKAAVALGIPLKCSYKINEFEYEGYLKGKSWRGKMKNMDKTTNIIMKDNCMFMWAEDAPGGTKMCMEEDIWDSEDAQFEQPDMEYICTPSVFSDEKFTPPSSVEFMDLNDLPGMMQNGMMPENMPSME